MASQAVGYETAKGSIEIVDSASDGADSTPQTRNKPLLTSTEAGGIEIRPFTHEQVTPKCLSFRN